MKRQSKPLGGRPKTTGKRRLVGVRLQKRDLEDLDAWCRCEGVTRPETIRRFLRLASTSPNRAKADPSGHFAQQRRASQRRQGLRSSKPMHGHFAPSTGSCLPAPSTAACQKVEISKTLNYGAIGSRNLPQHAELDRSLCCERNAANVSNDTGVSRRPTFAAEKILKR